MGGAVHDHRHDGLGPDALVQEAGLAALAAAPPARYRGGGLCLCRAAHGGLCDRQGHAGRHSCRLAKDRDLDRLGRDADLRAAGGDVEQCRAALAACGLEDIAARGLSGGGAGADPLGGLAQLGSWPPAAVHFGPLLALWGYRLWYWYLRPAPRRRRPERQKARKRDLAAFLFWTRGRVTSSRQPGCPSERPAPTGQPGRREPLPSSASACS